MVDNNKVLNLDNMDVAVDIHICSIPKICKSIFRHKVNSLILLTSNYPKAVLMDEVNHNQYQLLHHYPVIKLLCELITTCLEEECSSLDPLADMVIDGEFIFELNLLPTAHNHKVKRVFMVPYIDFFKSELKNAYLINEYKEELLYDLEYRFFNKDFGRVISLQEHNHNLLLEEKGISFD